MIHLIPRVLVSSHPFRFPACVPKFVLCPCCPVFPYLSVHAKGCGKIHIQTMLALVFVFPGNVGAKVCALRVLSAVLSDGAVLRYYC